MRIAAVTLALIAVACLGTATFLEPYKDRAAVAEAMTAYPDDIAQSRAASEKYWAVRDSQLTLKFTLQDYGFTALTLLIGIGLVRVNYRLRALRDILAIATPEKRWIVFALGLSAGFLTTGAYVASLLLDASRDAFPPWADSLGIPLAAVPFIFVVLTVSGLFFSVIGTTRYIPKQSMRNAFRRATMPSFVWVVLLGAPLVVSAAAVITTTIAGDFVFLAPSLLWLVFCAFVYAAHQKPAD